MANQQSTGAGLRELALFAGAGGGILGGKLLGWQTVCAVEWGEYPAGVLCARQNDGFLPPFPIWDNVETFDGRPWRGIVDVVSGGFPCQDISTAGRGAGITGERSGMWGHMARIIGEVRPRFAFVENSPALLTRGLGVVLGDLAALGYDCRWTVLGAADVGANHQRDRFWLVATDATSLGQPKPGEREHPGHRPAHRGGQASHAHHVHGWPAFPRLGGDVHGLAERLDAPWAGDWEIGTPRVAASIAARSDRLKAIGNGQVPICAATAWRLLGGVTA